MRSVKAGAAAVAARSSTRSTSAPAWPRSRRSRSGARSSPFRAAARARLRPHRRLLLLLPGRQRCKTCGATAFCNAAAALHPAQGGGFGATARASADRPRTRGVLRRHRGRRRAAAGSGFANCCHPTTGTACTPSSRRTAQLLPVLCGPAAHPAAPSWGAASRRPSTAARITRRRAREAGRASTAAAGRSRRVAASRGCCLDATAGSFRDQQPLFGGQRRPGVPPRRAAEPPRASGPGWARVRDGRVGGDQRGRCAAPSDAGARSRLALGNSARRTIPTRSLTLLASAAPGRGTSRADEPRGCLIVQSSSSRGRQPRRAASAAPLAAGAGPPRTGGSPRSPRRARPQSPTRRPASARSASASSSSWPVVGRPVLGGVHGEMHGLAGASRTAAAATAHVDPRAVRRRAGPRDRRGRLGAGQPVVEVDHRGRGRRSADPRVGVHDAADRRRPASLASALAYPRPVSACLGGSDVAGRDEQVDVGVAAVLAGLVQQRA